MCEPRLPIELVMMIDQQYLKTNRDRQLIAGSRIIFNAVIAGLLCLFVVQVAPLLGQVATFIGFDLILSVYLASLFRGKYRFLFLLHPVFAFISAFGFEMPFTEIGVAFTYLNTFEAYVDPSTLVLDVGKIWEALFYQDIGAFGVGVVYVGAIPILWLPSYLFADPSDIAIYLSLGVFTLLYAAVAVSLALFFQVMRRDVLLMVALFSTISPTFLEINSNLHRYGLLFFGLFLFLIAYTGLTRKPIGARSVPLSLVMLVSIVCVGVSKAPLFLSLALFVFLDRLALNKLPIVSAAFVRSGKTGQIFAVLILIALIEILGKFVAPERYVSDISMQGGQYQGVFNIPVLNLAMRLIYATLSPFPWFGFSQFELYGFNVLFLFVHILSSGVALWIIISTFSRFRFILKGPDDARVSMLFGVSVMLSLAFSAIGYHAYLAPALPFLATVMLEKANRVKLIFPIGFCVLMEGVAQIIRIV